MPVLRPAFLLFAGITVACAIGFLSAQNKTESPTVVAVEGSQIFRDHCAVCHGKDGRGRGPATIALKDTVPDLTVIARRNGGVFPATRVKAVIDGTQEGASAHGSREMPVLGPIFHNFEWDQDLGEVRLQNITDYLRSIQGPYSGGECAFGNVEERFSMRATLRRQCAPASLPKTISQFDCAAPADRPRSG